MRLSRRAAVVTLLLLWAALAVPAELRASPALLGTVGRWCLLELLSYGTGKAIDWATGQDFRRQLEKEIPLLVAQVAAATGPERTALQESLDLHRQQLAMLTRLTSAQKGHIEEIRKDQEHLLRRVDRLEARFNELEKRVGLIEGHVKELDARVSRLEEALIRECLDLRHADLLGADNFRVKESAGGWLDDEFESDRITVEARLLLNTCTGDLTQRGLLLQLSLVTRDLDKDLSLYATFKGVYSGGGQMTMLTRREIPLARPSYRLDGQVVELFFPYGEIPDLSSPGRIALALVLTHDGEVLYTLPDRVMSCVFGQRVKCQWRR
ncbi:MAG TPA: hypothetical protein VHN15_13435 [Thermoanaerobaculia bacterium]|nr:hypothetical protein [Thermoanaerobaculia bacterium]